MIKTLFLLIIALSSSLLYAKASPQSCQQEGVWLQVLGSGGPEMTDKRASSSYLIWHNGKAVAMVDSGSGSLFQFEQTGADFADIRALFYSHFHVDHAADLPGFIKASFFIDRSNDLYIFGPSKNHFMPNTQEFVNGLFASNEGIYQYLSSFIEPGTPSAFKIKPTTIDVATQQIYNAFDDGLIKASSIPVHHGPIPSLAWRIEIAGKVLVFSGDNSGKYKTLAILAENADLLVAHNAVPEGATGVGRFLHMPPSVIGDIAKQSHAKKLILSHRMLRTIGKEQQTKSIIQKVYKESIEFADDLDCFKP